MSAYRTPDEDLAQAAHRARIRLILDRVIHDGAMCMVAIKLDESQATVDQWTDSVWNVLRDELIDDRPDEQYGTGRSLRIDDRLAAIVMLLEEPMQAEARRTLAGLRAVAE
ncbi:hypothetical protein AB0M54_24520 [Actinoplanes sp. NPDC051470]|uniref:hypothetical protein n=1 Tax=Actinoplanes sp. NPDC051470 TaxID=3157224 RepID=UPI0034405670